MAHAALRRIPPPRTLTIDSAADLQALRLSLRRRRALPRVRVALRLIQLSQAASQAHERELNRLFGRAPFWAAAGGALLMATVVLVFPIDPAGAGSPLALVAWAGECVLAAAAGWLVGTEAHRAQTRWQLGRLCEQIQADVGN